MTRVCTIDLAPLPMRNYSRAVLGGVFVSALHYAAGASDPHYAWMIVAATSLIVGAAFEMGRRLRRVRVPEGSVFTGRIESKLGPFALQVVDGELRACPFVVRLDDGRVALVGDAALVLETEDASARVDVGSSIELIGNPTLTPYAPEGYRGASALRFQGEYGAPVGIRAV